MKKLSILSGVGVALLSSCTQETPPNVLFILVDDLGWADVACNHPETNYQTPHIDELANEGVRFANGYASCPVSSPTRASLMTGKYPARMHITDWIPGANPQNRKLIGPKDKHQLPLEEVTIAETFQQNGYATAFFGKWHLGSEGFFPEQQGFGINKGGHHRGSPPGGYYDPYKNPKLGNREAGEYLPDRLTNEVMQFIDEQQGKPFFAYLSFYTVHTPIQASKKHIEQMKTTMAALPSVPDSLKARTEFAGQTKLYQDNAAYASMVMAMDENVGRLVAHLKEKGLYDNTIIVFTSDNGGLSTLRHPHAPTSNEPLRAGKGWCYEGGIRVPLIIKAPHSQQGMVSEVPAISNDLPPTLTALAGFPPMPQQHRDGKDLSPLLTGENKIDRETLFWHYPHYHGSMWTPGAAVRHDNWKLVVHYHEEKTELFDLSKDPSEQNDISADVPEKVTELTRLLQEWQTAVDAQMPKQNPKFEEQQTVQ